MHLIIGLFHPYKIPAGGQLRFNIPVNNFSVMSGWSHHFLCRVLTSTVGVNVFLGVSYEPRREKTGLRDFRTGPTQTGLYSLRR